MTKPENTFSCIPNATRDRVFELLSAGQSVTQVAKALGISTHTVHYHKRAVKNDRLVMAIEGLVCWAAVEGAQVADLVKASGLSESDIQNILVHAASKTPDPIPQESSE